MKIFGMKNLLEFIELDKLVSGTYITKKCSLFSGTNKKIRIHVQVHTCAHMCTCTGAHMQNSN